MFIYLFECTGEASIQYTFIWIMTILLIYLFECTGVANIQCSITFTIIIVIIVIFLYYYYSCFIDLFISMHWWSQQGVLLAQPLSFPGQRHQATMLREFVDTVLTAGGA